MGQVEKDITLSIKENKARIDAETKVEETKVEAPVETKVETKVEEKTETKVEPNAAELPENLKKEIDEIVAEAKKPVESKPEAPLATIELPDEYKNYEKTHKTIESNPLLKQLYDYAANGGNIEELLEQSAGEINYEEIPDNEIFVEAHKDLGYTPEEMKEALDDFNTKKDYQKKAELRNMRSQLKAKKPVVNGKVKEILEKTLPVKQKQTELLSKSREEASSALKSKVGELKEFNGFQIPKEDIKEVYELAAYYTPQVSTKEGEIKYDTDKGLNTALILKYHNAILESTQEKYLRMGAEMALKKRIGPNASDGSVAPAGQKDEQDEKRKRLENTIKKQTGK